MFVFHLLTLLPLSHDFKIPDRAQGSVGTSIITGPQKLEDRQKEKGGVTLTLKWLRHTAEADAPEQYSFEKEPSVHFKKNFAKKLIGPGW